MGVVSVNELKGVRTAKIGIDWKRSYHRSWRVITDDPATGGLEARLAIPVQLGYAYDTGSEHDFLSFATNIEAVIDTSANDDCQWIVNVEYTWWDPVQWPENPLNQPLKITWGGSRFQKVVERTVPDDNGNTKVVVNSAGDAFDPPITIDDSRPTLHIVRNERTFDPGLALAYKDTVNKYVFVGFPPKTVKLSLPTGDLSFNPVCGFYYSIQYEFEINPETWTKKILDQGLNTWDGTSPDATPATDENGDKVTVPVLLNGSGKKLDRKTGVPKFLEFEVYQQADFDELNFNFDGAPGQ